MIGNLVDTSANIEFGILIAVAIVAILLYSLVSANANKQLNALSYIIGAVLVWALSYQMSRLLGAIDIMSARDSIADFVMEPLARRRVKSFGQSEIGWFIFRRVMWSALFTAIAGFCIWYTMETSARNPRKRGRSTRRRAHRSYDNDF